MHLPSKQAMLLSIAPILLVIGLTACTVTILQSQPTTVPPIVTVVPVPITVVVTQVIPPTTSPPTIATRYLRATFWGQDGASYAGQLCERGTANDNIHIRLNGLRTDVQTTAYIVEDRTGGGKWATPCNPVSNWLLYVIPASLGQADLYFKPFRDAPDNTEYTITVRYADGTAETTSVLGSRVRVVLSATFLGQDGGSYAGRLCTTGNTNDNVHIHLNGLRPDKPISYRVEERAGGGVWATPCDPISNWLLYVTSNASGQADLYFKPFRDAPDGTEYTIIVRYGDGYTQTTTVVGSRVKP